jgi:peptide-methionine (S)-S-oxide reductase
MTNRRERATFAAGCFWGIEAAFREVEGVLETSVGYTGGHEPHPTYDSVGRGNSGHAEAVVVWFDPDERSYDDLLQVFWAIHDPTSNGFQGWDIGDQYRSEIFTHSDEQRELALASRERAQAEHARPILTEVSPGTAFHPAEKEHQRYFEKHGGVPYLATTLR